MRLALITVSAIALSGCSWFGGGAQSSFNGFNGQSAVGCAPQGGFASGFNQQGFQGQGFQGFSGQSFQGQGFQGAGCGAAGGYGVSGAQAGFGLSLIHISEPTRPY